MLKVFILSLCLLFVLPSHYLNFVILFCLIYFYYLSTLNLYFSTPLTINIEPIIMDETSVSLTLLLFFVIFVSYITTRQFKNSKLISILLLLLFFFCFQVFNTIHLFSLYFYYEASLIPILFIILKWGSYPERSTSSIIIVSYTLLFGAPLFIIIISLYYRHNTWILLLFFDSKVSGIYRIFLFLCFAVKLPIYGLHYWLPMAHVEAPTFGSVILARLLLKLGGVGLLRILPLLDLAFLKSILLSYLILLGVFSLLICCSQSDFKRLIAYSSVSHIIVIPFLILRDNILSVQSLIFIIVFHGLRAAILFFMVGLLYTLFSSRQLIVIRGLLLVSPLLRFFLILSFFYTMSAPPFPSYLAEVYFIFSSYILSSYMLLFYMPFIFLRIVYNLNWLTSILIGTFTTSNYRSAKLSYVSCLPLCLILIFSLFWIIILYKI
jgi:NADH:ubiquinone oxidoreductase subunit 4 (subunit M)